MKEIFADFYNKIVDFFKQIDAKDSSKNVARNRLKLVLMQDRTNINPRLLERMRGEMIELLSKYVEIDKAQLELNLTPEDDQFALMLSIPVIRAREEEEIEAILKAEDEAKALKEETKLEENEETSENNVSEENISQEEIDVSEDIEDSTDETEKADDSDEQTEEETTEKSEQDCEAENSEDSEEDTSEDVEDSIDESEKTDDSDENLEIKTESSEVVSKKLKKKNKHKKNS